MTAAPYVRALDPGMGDVVHHDGGTWEADGPGTAAVVRTLRTVKGSFAPDRTFGTEYQLVDRQRPNAAATLAAVLREALARLVRADTIRELDVRTEVVGDQPRAEVSFVDPRDPRPGRRSVPIVL